MYQPGESDSQAEELIALAKKKGVPLVGGSSLKYAEEVQEVKEEKVEVKPVAKEEKLVMDTPIRETVEILDENNEENMTTIDLATNSFGQNFNVTMTQLCASFCSLPHLQISL